MFIYTTCSEIFSNISEHVKYVKGARLLPKTVIAGQRLPPLGVVFILCL